MQGTGCLESKSSIRRGLSVLAHGHKRLRSLGANLLPSLCCAMNPEFQKSRALALVLDLWHPCLGNQGWEVCICPERGRQKERRGDPRFSQTPASPLNLWASGVGTLQRSDRSLEKADNSMLLQSPRCWHLHFNGGG